MTQQLDSYVNLPELDELALVSTDGGVVMEAIMLGAGLTFVLLEAYQWGKTYAHNKFHP